MGVFQSEVLKVSVVGETVASPSSALETVKTTLASGRPVSTTWISSVVPVSSTPVEPDVSVTVYPATSSSVVVTETC